MSVDNNILSYNNDATFSGDSTSWFITCTKGGRITAKVDMYVDLFIVGGGGGGGKGADQKYDSAGGGGGGGGYRVIKKGILLTAGSYADVIIGSGGNAGVDGGASSVLGFTANGGSAGEDAHRTGNISGAVPGNGGDGGASGGVGVYISGNAYYKSSDPGADGGYAFDEPSWSATKYGAGGGGGCAVTYEYTDYGDCITGWYGTRGSGNSTPGGNTGGGVGGGIKGSGYDATNYGGGGGGGGTQCYGGKGYQGIVIIRSARGGNSLSINAGPGSTITVQRTSSSVSDLRTLLNGALIYLGDTLKVSFIPLENYEIITHTVNGENFVSGNTHTVSGDTTVVATARPLASDIGATDANIESVSTVTVTQHVNTYWHSIQYSFGSLSGYLTSSGSLSDSEVKFQTTSVPFTIPSSFYAQIPNAKTGVCTLTCRTYETSSSVETLGDAKTCTFTVTASENNCSPTIIGQVVDTNSSTLALTGDGGILIRYKSTAQCTITATARNGASIVSKSINGQTPNSNDVLVIGGDALTSGSFTFSATDSRGYTTVLTQTKTLIAYINLTINPVLRRPSPASGEVAITFNGNFYKGSFGQESNTLTIRYRYRDTTTSTWSTWITISASNYSIGTKTYSTSNEVLLEDINGSTTGFDYQKSYYFEIQALDGAGGVVLSTVSATMMVQRGIPVFDWGENDFRFNVPIKIGSTQLTEAQLIQLLALL